MKNFTDHHRDKPESGQQSDINSADFLAFLNLINSQKLVCLFNNAESKLICLADFDELDDQSIIREKNSGMLTEVDEHAFRSIWRELHRLKSALVVNKTESANIQVMLVIDTMLKSISKDEARKYRLMLKYFYSGILPTAAEFKGKVLNNGSERFYISFQSAAEALECSVQLRKAFYNQLDKGLEQKVFLKMGLSMSKMFYPEKESSSIVTKRSGRLCYVAGKKILLSSDLMEFVKSEHSLLLDDNATVLSTEDEKFVNMLLDCVEKKWQDESFLVDDFSKQLNWSKSQIYRKMISLLGLSPNNFIREYRLKKSIDLLGKQHTNIAEVAFESGFSSPSYFTKCFQYRFGLTPSDYLQTLNE